MNSPDIMATTKEESFIAEFARSLSDNELRLEVLEKMNHAMAINNTGALKVASILMGEMESRGISWPDLSEFKNEVDEAIRITLKAIRNGAARIRIP
jgi:hypothetical protein